WWGKALPSFGSWLWNDSAGRVTAFVLTLGITEIIHNWGIISDTASGAWGTIAGIVSGIGHGISTAASYLAGSWIGEKILSAASWTEGLRLRVLGYGLAAVSSVAEKISSAVSRTGASIWENTFGRAAV